MKRFSKKGFTLIELLIVISILVILAVSVAMSFIGFDYDARYNTTKSNLSSIKSAIQMYRSRHSKFPRPTVSGGTKSTLGGEATLEAILSNSSGHGDGQEYIGGAIPGELISDAQGANFICVVNTMEDYYANQADFNACENPASDDQPPGNGGGYVYNPISGALRLNFLVQGDSIRDDVDEANVGTLFDDWSTWSEKNLDLDDDYPVTW